MQRKVAMKKRHAYKVRKMYIATERSIDCAQLFFSENKDDIYCKITLS